MIKSAVNPEMGTTIPSFFQRYPKSHHWKDNLIVESVVVLGGCLQQNTYFSEDVGVGFHLTRGPLKCFLRLAAVFLIDSCMVFVAILMNW